VAVVLPEARWGPPRGTGSAMGAPLVAAVLLHGAIGGLLVLGIVLPHDVPEPAGGLVVELLLAAPAGAPAEAPLSPADEPPQPGALPEAMTPVAEPPPVQAAMPVPLPPPPAELAMVDPVDEPPPLLAEDAALPAPPPPAVEPEPLAPIDEPQHLADTVLAPAPPPAPPPRTVPPRAAPSTRAAQARPPAPRTDAAPRLRAAAGAAGEAPASTGTPTEPPGPPLLTAPRFRLPPQPPDYPRRAIELDLSGTVVVRALLDVAGNPRETRVHRSSGHSILDAAAIAAVRRWAFEPASVDGRRIEAWVEVPVRFRLH
jgi:protein TonB